MPVEDIIKVLEDSDIEVTDNLREEIENNYPEVNDTDDLFTQEDVNEIVQKRLTREQKLHEQEIVELKDEMEGLVDPDKIEEYESRIEELENKTEERTTELKKTYELQLAAANAGVSDQEYFEFLVEKKGLKDRIKTDDDGNVVATDEEGNILTENGNKLGPSALIDDIKEEKPKIFEKEDDDNDIGGGGGNPGGGTPKDVKKNTKNLAADLGYKTKDKEE
jgi:hypothetical protein